MSRRLLLSALVLCASAQAAAPPHLELTIAPAFKGWARPGRPTEFDVRLAANTPVSAELALHTGRQSVNLAVDLQPGRSQRLHLPAASGDTAQVSLSSPGGEAALLRRDVAVSRSERPLLGVALAGGETLGLDGFRSVDLSADDLPRLAASHAALDALVLDAATLVALDPRQLAALLSHAASCGRVVVLHADARVRQVLDGAGACGRSSLMTADSLAQARALLDASLGTRVPAAMSPGEAGALARPAQTVWSQVALGLAAYGAVLALLLVFNTPLPILLALPALGAPAALGLLHLVQPASQLVVWSEGESGARLARYQAWHQVPGLLRGQARVSIPPQLGAAARACDPATTLDLSFDAAQGRAVTAVFDTRLFRQVALCYSGTFPMARAFRVEPASDGGQTVHNTGPAAWPPGHLLANGRTYALPSVGAGARAVAKAATSAVVDDAALRTASARGGSVGFAALWELELGGVAGLPDRARGWLMIAEAAP